ADLHITDSTIKDHTTLPAVQVVSSSATIESSTFSNNGSYALLLTDHEGVSVLNSTFSGNNFGILEASTATGAALLSHVTITQNSYGIRSYAGATLKSSIVGGNSIIDCSLL